MLKIELILTFLNIFDLEYQKQLISVLKQAMAKKKKVIGRREKANFPSLGLDDIEVKIDTGAFTSSIHCADMKEIDGKLHCNFLDESHPQYNQKELIFDHYEMTVIKSSNGISELRYQIVMPMVFGKKSYEVELTLSDRAEMKFPVLLGRKFLQQGKFIVDVSKLNRLRKKTAKTNEKTETENGDSLGQSETLLDSEN